MKAKGAKAAKPSPASVKKSTGKAAAAAAGAADSEGPPSNSCL